jgi:hypothetical protein
VKSSSKDRPTLKTATVLKQLVSALEAVGFKWKKAYYPKSYGLTIVLNDETEVTLFPGVRKHSGSVVIDPVIALYNTKLKARILSSGWDCEPRVCHAHLGLLDTWDHLCVNNDDELEQAIRQVVRTIIDVGLPIMREYDSVEKVRQLFRDEITRTKRHRVAVLFEKEKLQIMEDH